MICTLYIPLIPFKFIVLFCSINFQAKYAMELTLVDYKMAHIKPSIIAAAALALSLKVIILYVLVFVNILDCAKSTLTKGGLIYECFSRSLAPISPKMYQKLP